MPIELDNTSINVINSADTFQVDFVKSKGSYTEKAADSSTYSCGSGWYGTLGHSSGGNDNKWWSPTLTQYFIDNKITIIDFSGGIYHSLFLDTNGYVYSCGENSEGRLGHGNTSNKSTPTLIENYIHSNGNHINYTNITISKISAGYYHSIFLDTNGNVYSCGSASSGKLGHGDTSQKTTPTLINAYYNINPAISDNVLALPIYNSVTDTLQTAAEVISGVEGWIRIKHMPSTTTHWYSGDDNFAGNYTLNNSTKLETEEWAISYSNIDWDEILFIKGNFDQWLRLNKSDLFVSASSWSTQTSIESHDGIGSTYKYFNDGRAYTPYIASNDSYDYNKILYKESADAIEHISHFVSESYTYDVFIRKSTTNTSSVNTEKTHNYITFTYDPNRDTNGQTEYNVNFPVDTLCDILIVGGGGGVPGDLGGGGGAGGLILLENHLLSQGTYNLKVGNGGKGGDVTVGSARENATDGYDSVFDIYTAIGGGRGGCTGKYNGATGGSGGGGSGGSFNTGGSGTANQGNNGGNGNSSHQSGGGGGAGGVGGANAGDGGIGIDVSNIFGQYVGDDGWFAGGGGGGYNNDESLAGSGGKGGGGNGTGRTIRRGFDGKPHTGGGGGGNANYNLGGAFGGSGVIIIRYAIANTNVTISQISAGTQHSMFLDTNGYVYSCGGGSNGQTGHGNTNTTYYIPTSILFFVDNGITISQISIRSDTSIFLNTNGYVYSCGNNYYGQLGHGDTTDKSTPTLIQTFTDSNGDTNYTAITISKISAGTQHSMFLDTNGYVYSCGNGSNGRTGHGNEANKSIPTLIETYIGVNSNSINYTDITISQVSSGRRHTIFLNTNSNVYTFGGNYSGELGYGVNNASYRPKLVEYFVNNNIIISYINAGIYHSIFLSNDPYYQTIEYDAQWTYSDTDASVYHLGNVGIGTYPSNTKILNVQNGINFTGDLYLNTALISTPKYKHTHIRENNKYFPDIVPSISPTYIPNSNEYQIYSFVYEDSNNNGNGQTEYTINFHQETECDILIVAGGGGGGHWFGGGGGAGGVVYETNINLHGQYILKVGKGGSGAVDAGDSASRSGTNGNSSEFNSIIAIGGGGGGAENVSASDGGSGGGAGYRNANTQGIALQTGENAFGNSGSSGNNKSGPTGLRHNGGGGGAGSEGFGSDGQSAPHGGDGMLFNITGYDNYYAGGGGGANANWDSHGYNAIGNGGSGIGGNGGSKNVASGNGQQHTGSGGGGGNNTKGGDGGSGIVIIRCKIVTSDLNIPVLSNGVITELNKFDQYNTLTFNYDTNYLKNIDYPLLATDAANLILQWQFDDPDNLFYDIVSETNTGVTYISGSSPMTTSDGIIGTGLNLETTTQDIKYDIPTSLINLSTTSHSFTFWIKLDSGGEDYGRMVTLYNRKIYVMGRSAGTSRIHVYNPLISTTYYKDDTLLWNKWYHFAIIVDVSALTLDMYINGIKSSDFSFTNIDTSSLTQFFTIGEDLTSTTREADGQIDDFRIYNKALSAEEVYDLYKPIDIANNQSKYTLQFDTDTECDFLVVAGGGGGCGNNNERAGGGGGAGELLEKYNITFSANTQYTIIVGNGGLGQLVKTSPAIEGYDSGIYTGTNGNTTFYHSKGGGRGGNGYYAGEQIFDATSGGSGGGAGMITDANNNVNGLSVKYNTDGRGHDGKINVGSDAGSGGGAGSIGEYASSSSGQAQSLPGKGFTSYITGEAVTYASGGYGGWQYSRNTANAGKGSGGWGYGGPQGQAGFPGGNGIDGAVIIRYKYVNTKPAPTITYSMNSWTYTDDGNVYYMGNVGIGINDPTATLDVVGNISATAKPFKILHPLDNSKSLYHGNIECPRYDNLYRGRATIINGTYVVDIDSECNDTGGLIEGTFEALNTDSQLYLQNNQTFDNVKGTIENGKIHIECENTEDEITINWIVIAERKDADVVKLNNTDSNGKMICEHFK